MKLITDSTDIVLINFCYQNFKNNSYYKNYDNLTLFNIMMSVIAIGNMYGSIYTHVENNKICSVGISFDYWKLKQNFFKSYTLLFPDSLTESNNIRLIESNNKPLQYLYLVCVDKEYRQIGLATELIKTITNKYQDCCIFTDVNNIYMKYILLKQNYQVVESQSSLTLMKHEKR